MAAGLTIWRNGKEHRLRFAHGVAEAPLAITGDAAGKKRARASPSCRPRKTFKGVLDFDYTTLEHRLRELAFLNSGVRIQLTDLRAAEPVFSEFFFEGGTSAYVTWLGPQQGACSDYQTVAINGEKDGISIDIAMQWNDSYHENMLCFTNNIRQRDGGTHLVGFRAALTRVVNSYATDTGSS